MLFNDSMDRTEHEAKRGWNKKFTENLFEMNKQHLSREVEEKEV
jgi:hypothetical protein